MKEPIIQLSLKDYKDLKQFKDNFHKKNFVVVYGVEYTSKVFYSDEEMNKALMTQIRELKKMNIFQFLKFKKTL